jgi:hypothetical protein
MITIPPVLEMTAIIPTVIGYLEPTEQEYLKGYVVEANRIIETKDWQDPKEFYKYNCKSDVGITGSICEFVAVYLIRKFGFRKQGTTIRYCSAHDNAKHFEYAGQDFLLNHDHWRDSYGANCKSAHITNDELRLSRFHMAPLARYKEYKVHRFFFVDRFNMKMVMVQHEDFDTLFNANEFTQRDDGYWVCSMDKVLSFKNTEFLTEMSNPLLQS